MGYATFFAQAKSSTTPAEPFLFLKPTTSYLPSDGTLEIPRGIIAYHEVELGLIISKRGRDIHPSKAHSYIAGYALTVDITARNLQSRVKSLGLPWSAAKGFDGFKPISTTFRLSADAKDRRSSDSPLP